MGLLDNLFGKRYTIGELMSIDEQRTARASGCSVSLADVFFTLKEESLSAKIRQFFRSDIIKVFYITLKLKVQSNTGNTHYVFIQLEPDFSLKNWGSNQVRIYCDCADFKYRSSYVLSKRDSLFNNDRIKTVLGQALSDAPKGKAGVTTLCKHAYAALSWVMSNYQAIMKTI